jgi:Ca2+-binding RTX toxin-like protein
MATIIGTEGDDFRDGTASADTILGLGGNDTLNGLGGADSIDGGSGDDLLDGGAANDTLLGGDGSDTLIGGAGNDSLNPGNSFWFDDIRPGSGNDTINLSSQTDSFAFLYYGDFDDYYGAGATGIVANLSGGGGADTIVKFGGTNTDTIIGLDVALYNDFGFGLYGTGRRDTFNLTNMNGFNPFGAYFEITPGGGVDSYVINGAAWGRINFDEGANFNPAPQGLIINLATGVIANDGFGNAETITYQNGGYIQRIRATSNNDSVTGTSNDEVFDLLGGNDTLNAGGGFDRLRYDQGIVWDLVVDFVDVGAGTATGWIDWRGDVSTFSHSFTGVEYIDGSINADVINGSGGNETLRGRGGNDTINGNGGNDTILGDDGGDWLDGGAGDDYINPGSDSGNFEEDVILGSTGNDTIDYSSVFSNFQTLAYANIGNGISFSFDRDTNSATVNKGASGTDTIQDLINPLDNGDGFQIYGTEFSDTFNINNPNGNFPLEVRGGRGADNYILGAGKQNALLSLSGDEEVGPTTQGAVVNLTLATGQIVNDGFGNTETISGPGYFSWIDGTIFADNFTGGGGDDRFQTFGGNNTINGGGGFDEMRYANNAYLSVNANLATGTATFTIDQGAGPQVFTDSLTSIEAVDGTRNGNDTITGSDGDNFLRGRGGNDSLVGGAGDDTLQGDQGNDTLRGGDGRDDLRGGDGNDLLDASGGSAATQGFGDFIEPGFGSNTIIGHAALFAEGEGIDIFYGNLTGTGGLVFTVGANGSGTVVSNTPGVVNDTFTFTHYFIGSGDNDNMTGSATGWEGWEGGAGNDTIDGGDGYDSLQYDGDRFEGGLGAVTVNFITGTATDGFGNTDTFFNIEEARGTQQNDTMTGGDLWVRLEGRQGNDLLTGSSVEGAELIGGDGNDTLIGISGFNYFEPGQGNDSITGGADFDMIDYYWNDPANGITVTFTGAASGTTSNDGHGTSDTFTGIELIRGTNFGDVMTGAAGEQSFNGLGGVDTINGGAGLTDWIDYGDSENKGGSQGAIVNFATNSFRDTYGLLDVVSNIENVWGSGWGDSVTGANGIDHRFVGNDGADTLNGANGNDTLEGGDMDDTIDGGDGNDSLIGGDGNDVITGGAGDDIILPGSGTDQVNGNAGFDTLAYIDPDATSGVNVAFFFSANPFTVGQVVDWSGSTDQFTDIERVIGTDFNDTMSGALTNRNIVLLGEGGNDGLTGGSGNDTLDGGQGNDTINGGAGSDWITYRVGGTQGVVLNFASGSFRDTFNNTDTLSNIENVIGSDFGDVITGNSGIARVLQGNGGNDTIQGGDQADTIEGGDGNDGLNGGGGADSITGGLGNDAIDGSFGGDIIRGQEGEDTLSGGFGLDLIFGGSGNDLITGGADQDTLYGDSGADTLDGGENSDRYFLGDVFDTLNDTGTVGYDEAFIISTTGLSINVSGWTGIERINGFNGNDTLNASSATTAWVLSGENGDDSLTGSAQDDILLGGAGNDFLSGGNGSDQMLGGTGNDTFVGGAGDDSFFIGESGDVVQDGGTGFDKAVINNAAGVSIAMGTWSGVERVNGFTGNDSIDATGYATALIFDGRTGNDTLIGGSANDTFYAGDGDDVVSGGLGNDALIGDAGNDTLNGGAGDDFLLGLSGADVFVFDDGWGNDVVKDFTDGVDRLNFALHSAVNSLSDLLIEQVGANTRITLVTPSGDVLTLADFDAVDLGASDFQFA